MTASPSSYRAPALSAGQKRAVQLDLFSWLNELRSRKLITVNEAAAMLRCSPDYIRDVIELGELEVFELAAKGSQAKPQYRITVASFLLYVASRSVLSPEDRDDLFITFVDKLDARSCDRLQALLTTRRARLARPA